MRALDLFAGAGGASLGLHQAGLDLVAAAEWGADACATHRAALPDCPVHEGDVRRFDPPAADVWWASPPCQAWSIAGARLGAQDERNGWPWVWEAYDRAAVKPRWLFVENVAGMTHHSKAGHGDPLTCAGCYLAEVVLPELRARFPHVVSRVLDAADYGVPQHRRRLFIVASVEPYTWPTPTHCLPGSLLLGCGRQPWQTMGDALGLHAIGGGSNPHGAGRAHERTYADLTDRPCTTITSAQVGNAGPWVLLERPAPTVTATEGKGRSGRCRLDRALDALYLSTSRRRLTVEECATLQGFPPRWPWTGTKTQQYRQVGNAVPPALARALAEQVVS